MGSKKRILVIEDEREIVENILEALDYEGFEGIGAYNGREGIEKARQYLPDLIVCDIKMPDADGYTVLMEMQAAASTALIPFIFLTARTTYEDLRKGMELGADDYLFKPFLPTDLIKAINTRLERQGQIQQVYEQRLEDVRQRIITTLPHELRTPMTGIMGYMSLLIEDFDDLPRERIFDMLKLVDRSSRRLYRLIENYLVYSQLELMHSRGERFPVGLHEAFPAAQIKTNATSRAQLLNREADLHIDVQDADVQITSDSLRKITEELVDNAFKFSPTGTPVEVSAGVDGEHYLIQIRNGGRGMLPEDIANIGAYMQFGRKQFEQQGSGLGLIISKRLIELHGGDLHIESIPDQVTVVEVRLRLA